LQNESDQGFISREFFQIKIEILYPSKELSGKEKRAECKKLALLKREEVALPYLIEVHRDKYRFGDSIERYNQTKEGKARILQTQKDAQNSNLPGGALIPGVTGTTTNTNTQTNQNQLTNNPITQKPAEKINITEQIPYIQNFSWFFKDLNLYKEDYTNKSKCAFLFRIIQEDLYAKVESTSIPDSIYRKEESILNESEKQYKNNNPR